MIRTHRQSGRIVVKNKKGVAIRNDRTRRVHEYNWRHILDPCPFAGNDTYWRDALPGAIVRFWVADVVGDGYLPLPPKNEWEPAHVILGPDLARGSFNPLSTGLATKINERSGIPAVPSIDSIDGALRILMERGRIDLAAILVMRLYGNHTSASRTTHIQFAGFPGESLVILAPFRKRATYRRAIMLPPFPSRIMFYWWGIHGGWHYKGDMYEPYDFNRAMEAADSPWAVAGSPIIRESEMVDMVTGHSLIDVNYFKQAAPLVLNGVAYVDEGERIQVLSEYDGEDTWEGPPLYRKWGYAFASSPRFAAWLKKTQMD